MILIFELFLVEKLSAEGKRSILRDGGDEKDLRIGFHWPPFITVPHLHLHLIYPASEMDLVHKIVFKPNTIWFHSVNY